MEALKILSIIWITLLSGYGMALPEDANRLPYLSDGSEYILRSDGFIDEPLVFADIGTSLARTMGIDVTILRTITWHIVNFI